MIGTMKVLVLDSVACVGPESLRMVSQALELRVKLAVPDVLYARELHANGGERLRRLGLRVESLAGIEAAVTLYRQHPHVSLMDAFALALAATNAWAVLTTEPALATIARELRVPIRDPHWLATEVHRRSARSDSRAVGRASGIGYPSHVYAACASA